MLSEEERLLADFIDPTVAASQSYPFFEGWTDTNNQLQTRIGNVPFNALQDFLDSSNTYAIPDQVTCGHRFRVISFSSFQGERLKLFFPKETYEQIKRSWKLHSLTAEVFINNNGVLSRFEMKNTTCIMMKVAASRSIGIDGVSIAHNRKNRTTNVLYHRLGDEKSIFKTLQGSPERCLQPAFFAAVLHRCHQKRVEVYRSQMNEEITRVERLTKFGGPGRLSGHRDKQEELDQRINSDSAIKKLSYIQTELAVMGHVGRSSLELGQWLVNLAAKDRKEYINREEVLAKEINDPNQQSADSLLQNIMVENTTGTLDETEYVRRRATTVLSQLQAIKDRVDSQTNFVSLTVIFDLWLGDANNNRNRF
jgi:hypothetical protein